MPDEITGVTLTPNIGNIPASADPDSNDNVVEDGINGVTTETGSPTVNRDNLKLTPNEQNEDVLPSETNELTGDTNSTVNGVTITEEIITQPWSDMELADDDGDLDSTLPDLVSNMTTPVMGFEQM